MKRRPASLLLRPARRSAVLAIGVALTAIASGALAHPNHGTAITREQATQVARRVLAEMIKLKVVEASWSDASPPGGERKERDGHMEWVFSYLNLSAEKEGQRVLYIFLAESGEFIAANYSGQ